MNILLAISAFAGPEAIIVTGSREPLPEEHAPVSADAIERERIESLALPQAADMLRHLPGVSVSVSGPRGTQTQVRIRGAEANHTLLFVDGIRFNDPAAGNEARFELLGTDLLSRIELVRGPQSALWGSEALGGVVAVETANPFDGDRLSALGEFGSLGSGRAAAQAAVRTGDVGVAASAAWMRSDGIDSFGGDGGDCDGFENRSAGLRAVYRPEPGGELGVSAFFVEGISEYDGLPPPIFRRGDTLDETESRIWAVRGWGSAEHGGWALTVDGSLLGSANRNRLGVEPLNGSFGRRFTAGAQLSRRLGRHRVTAALEHEGEDFRARDRVHFGGTDQDRSRALTALAGEWHAVWSDLLVTDVAVRHDRFSAFADATTLRAGLVLRPASGWSLHGSWGEGIAQPTFYDLYGFFPGSFVGNPALRPERSRGWEAGLRWEEGRVEIGATVFASRLRDEIVDVFETATFLASTRNVEGTSRRRGIELSGDYGVSQALQLSANYTFLDADERQEPAGIAIREVRRPRHSANLIASGERGRLSWGGSLAYVGARHDVDFDLNPSQPVRLDPYVLASLRLGYRLTSELEAYARVENGLDADYQDVVGYNTAGRTVHAGLRLRFGR